MLYDEAEYNLHDDDINLGADEGDLQITHFAPPLSRLPHFGMLLQCMSFRMILLKNPARRKVEGRRLEWENDLTFIKEEINS